MEASCVPAQCNSHVWKHDVVLSFDRVLSAFLNDVFSGFPQIFRNSTGIRYDHFQQRTVQHLIIQSYPFLLCYVQHVAEHPKNQSDKLCIILWCFISQNAFSLTRRLSFQSDSPAKLVLPLAMSSVRPSCLPEFITFLLHISA